MADINEDCLNQPFMFFESVRRKFNRQGEPILKNPVQILGWSEWHFEEPFDEDGTGRAKRHQIKVPIDTPTHSILLPGLIEDIATTDLINVLQVVEFDKWRCLSAESYDRWASVIVYRKKVIVKSDGTVLIDSMGQTLSSDAKELLIEG